MEIQQFYVLLTVHSKVIGEVYYRLLFDRKPVPLKNLSFVCLPNHSSLQINMFRLDFWRNQRSLFASLKGHLIVIDSL